MTEAIYLEVSEKTEAAKKAGINIPTLCYLKDINQIGACRLCMVDTGARALQAACVLPVTPGMKVRTNTPAILYGSLEVLSSETDPFFVFRREYRGECYRVICNFEQSAAIQVPENAEVLLHNYADREDRFRPYEVMILKEN